jgi:hypothetical protein
MKRVAIAGPIVMKSMKNIEWAWLTSGRERAGAS